MKRVPSRLLLLLPVVVLTACGGGDRNAKAAYVEQATIVCEQARSDIAALSQPTMATGFGPFVGQSVAIAAKAQQDLAALTPPEPDRAELESKVLDPFAAFVVDGKAFAERVNAAAADQIALLALLSERPTPDDVDLDYLRAYGLEACADAIDPT